MSLGAIVSNFYLTDDTIAAVATAPGGAYRGILRLSGPQVVATLDPLFAASSGCRLSDCRQATVLSGRIQLESWKSTMPCDLYFWPDARSYTRQVVAELHTVGSPPLLEACLRQLCRGGARQARPGEFTFRAFLAGRLDLTQAEAVLGVIDAASRRQLDAALRQLAGGLATPLNKLRDQLLDLLAHLEAGLDFVEEDIETIGASTLEDQLRQALAHLSQVLDQMTSRENVIEHALVVFVGAPNVGKSSLLNALTGQRTALVSSIPGTTRDYVTRQIEIDGLTCELVDTAGHESVIDSGQVSRDAQRMSVRQHEQADLQLFCIDSTRSCNAWERDELRSESRSPRLVVATKIDRQGIPDVPPAAIRTSAVTGAGLESLRRAIVAAVASSGDVAESAVTGTASRCHSSLDAAKQGLERACQITATGEHQELVAAEVRFVLESLGEVVGAVYTDDILDRIFSRFCVGK